MQGGEAEQDHVRSGTDVAGRRHSAAHRLSVGMTASVDQCLPTAATAEQRQIWQSCLSDPGSSAHTLLLRLDIAGTLDCDRVRNALRALEARYGLNDRFEAADGVSLKRYPGTTGGALKVIDTDEDGLITLIEAERQRGFDLAYDPLFVPSLFRLGSERHVIVLCAHRLTVGRAGLLALGRDLGRIYGNRPLHGLEPPPREPDQRDEELAVACWKSCLKDSEPLLAFPTDTPRPPCIVGNSSILKVSLPVDLTHRLRQAAAQRDIRVDEILLAAFQTFLFRYSGERMLVIGVPAPAGSDAESVPLSHELDPAMPFMALLGGNRLQFDRISDRSGGIFAGVVDRLVGDPQSSHAPLFQHRFSYLAAEACAIGMEGLHVTVRADPEPIGQLDLSLSAVETETGLDLLLRYNSTLFAEVSAERWAGNLLTLLEAVAADPDAAIGSVPILHAAEHRYIRRRLDQTGGDFKLRHASVPAMFEEQVGKNPDALAVRCGSSRLTYSQLDARANAIARHLRALGLASGDLVGICTARTPDMIAAVLGILKVGAAYVPMDLTYPAERLEAIAHEARLRWLLCDNKGSSKLTVADLAQIELADIASTALPLASPPADDETLCHVIFTSGSTGKPKGVMTRHRNVLAFMEWLWATFSKEDLANVLCCSSLSFDMTVFEIWGPLSTGGTIVLVENGASVVQAPEAQISLVTTVPTSVRLMVDEQALPQDIRVVIACGEPLDGQLAQDLFAVYPAVAFYNTYGPTEDTVFSTWYRLPGPTPTDPPIGLPIVHEFAKIVDPAGQLVPVGAIGELLMGGAGVARGYINNLEQTARAYQQSTDYDGRPASIYRTGDFVRLGNDGQIHFVGRRDDQVKLRGFRVDLGDVTAAIVAQEGVIECRVQVVTHGESNVLVAYVSHAHAAPGAHENPVIAAALEQAARARLPSYMVPSQFVLFDKLPLNDNGKVDRAQLRNVALHAKPRALSAPLAGDERIIADIWQAVLGVTDVGREDDFFLLGGNSLQAVRMISRVNKAFSTSLVSQLVFEHPSVAQLAECIRRESGGGLPVLQRYDLGEGVAPTFAQLAMLMDSNKASFNMCSALRVEGRLDELALDRALSALVQRHDALRAVFRVNGFQARMEILPEVNSILRVIAVDDEEQALAGAAAERRRPFDLGSELPVRALLLRIASDRHVFLLSIHHVVADEWSINLVRRDLAALFEAETKGRAAILPPLPIRFADFVKWQGLLQQAGAFERQIGYWAGEFASIVVEREFAATGSDSGPPTAFRTVALPQDGLSRIRKAVDRHGVTPYVLWLSALHLSLVDHSGLDQQLIWSPIAWRSDADLEESLGLYTNLGAMALRSAAGESLRQFVANVDAKAAAARRNGAVSALTAVMRDPTALPPLPMIGFNFIELPDEWAWHFSGTQTTPFALKVEEEADLCALELTVRVLGDEVGMDMAYDTRLFGASAIDRITGGIWTALALFGEDPDRQVAEALSILQAEELAEVS